MAYAFVKDSLGLFAQQAPFHLRKTHEVFRRAVAFYVLADDVADETGVRAHIEGLVLLFWQSPSLILEHEEFTEG
jgi:hypothetical protein